jgi:hypothetical protein
LPYVLPLEYYTTIPGNFWLPLVLPEHWLCICQTTSTWHLIPKDHKLILMFSLITITGAFDMYWCPVLVSCLMITWWKKMMMMIIIIMMPICCVFKTNNRHHQNRIRKKKHCRSHVGFSIHGLQCFNVMHICGSQDMNQETWPSFTKIK